MDINANNFPDETGFDINTQKKENKHKISLVKAHHKIFTSWSHLKCNFSPLTFEWEKRNKKLKGERWKEKLPRGLNSIWLIDFMICERFMCRKEIFLSYFYCWAHKRNWKRVEREALELSIIFLWMFHFGLSLFLFFMLWNPAVFPFQNRHQFLFVLKANYFATMLEVS